MAFTLSDFLRTRVHELRQPSPILEFWELALPDGGYLRLVDFADKDAGGSLPDKVPFNGVEFTAMSVVRGEIQESSDGGAFQLPVAIHDPLGVAAAYMRQWGGLDGQACKWWLTTYDRLAVPADAFAETFEVVQSYITQGPNTATLLLGHPNLYETSLIKLLYGRKCNAAYQNRFVVGNRCTYPSHEFAEQKREDFRSTADYGEQLQRHGWRTQQARRASDFDVDVSNAGQLTIESAEPRIAWRHRERYGPYFYRPLAGDFDVETQVILPATSRLRWMAGLLIQEPAAAAALVASGEEAPAFPTSSWLLYGSNHDGASSNRLLLRSTTASVTGPDQTVSVSDLFLRVSRVGNSWTFYSKSSASASWASRFTSSLILPTLVNVGLVAASDERTTATFTARFEFLRFALGGLPQCLRTFEECDAHENLVQFGGFREMPQTRS
jgi:hypothetical protein